MLACVTAHHRVTPLPILEKLASDHDGIAEQLVAEFDCVNGAIVVATCNRFEAYLDLEEPLSPASEIGFEIVLEQLSERSGVPLAELEPSLQVHTGMRAVEHLFAVASGLESVVVGETEIAGQVRTALEQARRAGTTSRDLERAFQQASQTSRGVRAATGLETVGRSLAELALELASSRIDSWETARVVLIGTGQYARVAVAALRRRGARDIAVHSRSGRAAAFGIPRGLTPLEHEEAPAALAAADVIVTCSTRDIVVEAADHASTRDRFAQRHPQLIVDLGLPRNVDPAISTLPEITLLDLETVRLHAGLDEFAVSDDARALVSHATDTFAAESRELDAVPAISALHRHMADILDAEVARSAARGEGPEVAAALRHLAGVLLHEPTVRAREHARAGQAERVDAALETLFDVTVDRSERRGRGSLDAAAG